MYTDPAIHTFDAEGADLFSGNMGISGINQFLHSHRCNPLCHFLGLPPIDPVQVIPILCPMLLYCLLDKYWHPS